MVDKSMGSIFSDDPEDEANFELDLEYEEKIQELDFSDDSQESTPEDDAEDLLDDYWQEDGGW